MDIGNRNTNRVKIFMRKRLRIAVFLAVLLGIVLQILTPHMKISQVLICQLI